ncbi:hypothetical protein CASFOL_042961 [Castilleja foliolosa]|uniref:Katanin p80 subunit C-terminal domain-containing protein n=1 Tax=Castilleja foliolosa TaxID=1961234 RepID=A0ABD3B753_9LAMI
MHASVSLEILLKLLAVFGTVVRSTVSAPRSVGVDLHAEERLECCKQCFAHLHNVQQSLPELVKRGVARILRFRQMLVKGVKKLNDLGVFSGLSGSVRQGGWGKKAADYNVAAAQQGIIYIDEVDKITKRRCIILPKDNCFPIDQGEISPLLPKSCRYVPTCSGYSMNAYKKYGVAKGTISTAYRLCRCNIDCLLSLLLRYTTTIFKSAGDDAVGLEQQEDADGITLLKVRCSARFMSFNVWSQGRYF